MRELVVDLKRALRQSSGVTVPEQQPPKASPHRRHRIIAIIAVALIVLTGVELWKLRERDYFWRNPLEGAAIERVTDFDADEVDAAIRSAHEAFKTWKNTPIGARMRIMLKYQALIREHMPRIAKTLTA